VNSATRQPLKFASDNWPIGPRPKRLAAMRVNVAVFALDSAPPNLFGFSAFALSKVALIERDSVLVAKSCLQIDRFAYIFDLTVLLG
jgi:hypothetical protein